MCSFNHSYSPEYEIRLVKIRIAAAISGTALIDAAKVIFQERAGSGASCPRFLVARFRAFKICFKELFACHRKTARQSVDLLFAKPRLHLSAAVGAFGAVNSGPHATGDSKNAGVDLIRFQIAPRLQELPKTPIFVFFALCLFAYLYKIESHTCLLFFHTCASSSVSSTKREGKTISGSGAGV